VTIALPLWPAWRWFWAAGGYIRRQRKPPNVVAGMVHGTTDWALGVVELGTGRGALVGARTSWWWAGACDSQSASCAELEAECEAGVAVMVGAGGNQDGAIRISDVEAVEEVAEVGLLGRVERH